MGKVKNKKRLHQKAAAVMKDAKMDTSAMETDTPTAPKASSVVGGGMFSNLNIDIAQLESQLPDLDDARSVVTTKSLRGMNLSKKDKRKVKHEFLMKKIDVIQTAKKEAKAKKKREQTAIVGDLRPLEDTLPTLELLLKDTGHHKGARPEPKAKAINKTRKRQKDMMSDIALFKQVVKHPAYKENPLATISEHLHNKHKLDQQ